MGRKTKIKSYENTNLMLRNPDLLDKDTVAMSVHFMKRHLSVKSETRKWSLLQQMLFIMVLGRLKDWTSGNNDNVVILNNYNIMRELGWEFSEENKRKVGDVLRNEFTYMVKNSAITLQDAKTKKWITENLIVGAEGDSRATKVTINPKFMNHFEDLYFLANNFSQSFHQILEPDISSFRSKHSYLFFTDLRMRCEVSKNPVEFTVHYSPEELRNLFELKSDEYMRKDKDGKLTKFDYPAFERRVLNVAIEEINGTEQIKILPWENDKFFKKEKELRKVGTYAFKICVYDLDTIKNNRIQLQEAAKRAGLNPKFYPDLKQSYPVEQEWKGKWRTNNNTNCEKGLKTGTDKNLRPKRKDKLSQNAQAMFGNFVQEESIDPAFLRPVSMETVFKVQNNSKPIENKEDKVLNLL